MMMAACVPSLEPRGRCGSRHGSVKTSKGGSGAGEDEWKAPRAAVGMNHGDFRVELWRSNKGGCCSSAPWRPPPATPEFGGSGTMHGATAWEGGVGFGWQPGTQPACGVHAAAARPLAQCARCTVHGPSNCVLVRIRPGELQREGPWTTDTHTHASRLEGF